MDKKISQLTAATTPLTGSELIPVVQSGQTVKATIDDIRGYKVYTALLTQSGGDNQLNIFSGSLTIGVTYRIVHDGPTAGDFTNVGAPNNDDDTMFVATGTTPNSWGDYFLSYNTGAPVVTVLENTIGNIWFQYGGVGLYVIYSDGLFTSGKTFIINGPLNNVNTSGWQVLYESPSADQLSIILADISGSNVNDIGDNLSIEIRVYN